MMLAISSSVRLLDGICEVTPLRRIALGSFIEVYKYVSSAVTVVPSERVT